ncbi:hypothetical protein BBG03_03430 [Streptococcus dysgalactiae subsp. equisimilis]|uniref:hypothetical protein n=1 Tax=Streptococcus dysgalactiae TaxID=1334 RepID=UPI000806F51C|nr:hypothetical protein [Streptococcus dysgalactiae]OBZ00647.1 hypothetical protein BBG03_03430 [Streptococcus dysgalactiae subsp. equisimilis]
MNFLTIRKRMINNGDAEVFETWLNDDDGCVVHKNLSYDEMVMVMKDQLLKMVELNIIGRQQADSIGRDWLLYDEIVERMIYS